MSTTIYRSFKMRLYPTKKQEVILLKHINCCRFMWNYMLNVQQQTYQETGHRLSRFQMSNLLKPLKQQPEYNFLNEVSNQSLNIICNDLNIAYQRYFDGISTQLPKFKSKKKCKMTFPVRYERFYLCDIDYLHVEKVGKIKYKQNYNIAWLYGRNQVKYINPRISKINNKWIITFTLSFDIENQNIIDNGTKIGIDLGIKEQAVVYNSNGTTNIFHNINKSYKVRNLKTKIANLHRCICRKYEMSRKIHNGKYIKSKNIIKEEQKLRMLYYKLGNIRLNYIHQITSQIIKLNPSVIIMEDLRVQQMMKNKYLSPYIHEQNFNTFKYIMQYKCEFNGIKFVLADKYFPSSKQCSNCKHIKKDLQLSDRTYVCECCGNIIDRDLNAARNLSRYDFHLEENQS